METKPTLETILDRLNAIEAQVITRMDNVSDHLTQLTKQVQGLEAQVMQLAGRIDRLETQSTQLVGRIDGLEAQVTQLAGRIDRLETQSTQLVGRIDGLEAQVTQLVGRIESLETQVAQFAGRMDGLDARVGRLEEQVIAGFDVVRSELKLMNRKLTVLAKTSLDHEARLDQLEDLTEAALSASNGKG
ncbi:MAG: hypothetical protein SNJ67_02265 [Chloracidobacterium sp.]|uniref:Uncharacterized protein n=1 Tax=Chloracidobacterium validum TaxID=2821543 RepID=A0ABX8BC14_9BACT|nr:hypothetical protein [Chloracidobacterium validum]QUW03325.1 hypothetical protein J8C06_02480 [Chloracidobacterium validum]